ncbi:1,4-dihydroxy-2-naphthoate polyprenyltransferase [bacterium BMS3Abin03]|jgi:1,4-dihydroxy-2-naphthoate octaprenyltransferase|nr:1,4-dihydroxy-2-naphthoate polyprenyltransferase [bacterium BMS3Abin03]MCG6958791.1 1,4-dihydroxy-2-naphthoate polyprenyltransferase [bacterium BMS3Abin03]
MNSTTISISKFQAWLHASRPKTLLAAVVPVMVGSALAIAKDSFTLIYSLVALLCSILIQIGTNFTNDLYDHLKGADKELRKGPLRVLSSGLISQTEMRNAIIFVFGLAFLLGLYLVYSVGIVVLIIGVISILAGIAYTAGPYPLAYHGLGDVFVFIFFGIVGTAGTYYLHLHEFDLISLLISIPVGALITNILVVNNYRDIEEDREAQKITLAVKFGRTFTKIQFIISIVVSYLILLILFLAFNFSLWIFLPVLSLPLAFIQVKMLFSFEGSKLNKTLEISAKYAALFGMLFSIGIFLY